MSGGNLAAGTGSGAEELKTAEHAARNSGKADEPFDPCYHQPCDTVDNVDMQVSDALAYALHPCANEPLQ